MDGECSMHGEMKNTEFLSENLKGRDNLKDPGIGGNIILEWMGKCGLVASGSG